MKPVDSNMAMMLDAAFEGLYKAYYADDDVYCSRLIVDGDIRLKPGLTQVPVKIHELKGGFDASGTGLTTLDNTPTIVRGVFDVSGCGIYTLAGGPDAVYGDYIVSGCAIKDFAGAPYYIGGDIHAEDTPVERVKHLTNRCDFGKVFLKGAKVVNERASDYYELLKDNNKVDLN